MANGNHPGLLQATEELRQLLANAREAIAEGRAVSPATRHLARLGAEGVEPIHILAMVCAVILFDQDQPRFLRGQTAYRFAVARAVAGLVPRGKMPLRSQTLAMLGDMLIDRYAVLAGGVAKAISDREAREQDRSQLMSQPFSSQPPTSTGTQGAVSAEDRQHVAS